MRIHSLAHTRAGDATTPEQGRDHRCAALVCCQRVASVLPACCQCAASVLLEGCECVPSEWLSEDATAVLKALMVLHRILRETSSKQRLYEKAQAFAGRALKP